MSELHLPAKTAAIFEWLSRGLFLSQNSQDHTHQSLYQAVEAYFEALHGYFLPLGFELSKGPGYFYFSREENRSTSEDKLEKLFRYLDYIEILLLQDPHLSLGRVHATADLLHLIRQQPKARNLMRKLSVKGGEDLGEKLKNMLKNLEKEGWLAFLDEEGSQFILLDSMHYLLHMMEAVQKTSGK